MALTRDLETIQNELMAAINKPEINKAEDLAKELLAAGGNLEFTDKDGLTPILLAAKSRWGMYVGDLIRLGANIYAKDLQGNTILHLGAESGSLQETYKGVCFWSQKKLDPKIKNSLGQTVIHAALKNPHYANVLGLNSLEQFAKTHGIDFYEKDINGRTAINTVNNEGQTAIFSTIRFTDLKLVQYLVEHGADLTIRDKDNCLLWQKALTFNALNDPLLEYLITVGKVSSEALELFLAHRELFFAVDSPMINRYLEQVDKPLLYREGGQMAESVRFLMANLMRFEDAASLVDSYQAILNADRYDSKLQYAGARTHLTLAAIKDKTPPVKQLCLYDSGYFSVKASSGTIYAVQVLEFDEKYTQAVLDLLKKTKRSTLSESQRILYQEIPALTHSHYENRTQKKPFKRGLCFYDNFKTMLLDDLILKHGTLKGRLIYKKLDIFLHQCALDKFNQVSAKAVHPRRDAILNKGKEIVAEKEKRLRMLYINMYFAAQKDNSPEMAQLLDPDLIKILNMGKPDEVLRLYQQEIAMIDVALKEIFEALKQILDRRQHTTFAKDLTQIEKMIDILFDARSFMDLNAFNKFVAARMADAFPEHRFDDAYDLLNLIGDNIKTLVRDNIKNLFATTSLADLGYKKANFLAVMAEQITIMQSLKSDYRERLLVGLLVDFYNDNKPDSVKALNKVSTYDEFLKEVDVSLDQSLTSTSQKGIFQPAHVLTNANENLHPTKKLK